MTGGLIPDLTALSEAAGREIPEEAATILYVRAAELVDPPRCRETARQADRIAKAARELHDALHEADGAAFALRAYVARERLDVLADRAELVSDRENSLTGPGRPPAAENLLLRGVASAALDAWHRAGGTGIGVHHSEYAGGFVGPVLGMVKEALLLAGARSYSDSSIRTAIRGVKK